MVDALASGASSLNRNGSSSLPLGTIYITFMSEFTPQNIKIESAAPPVQVAKNFLHTKLQNHDRHVQQVILKEDSTQEQQLVLPGNASVQEVNSAKVARIVSSLYAISGVTGYLTYLLHDVGRGIPSGISGATSGFTFMLANVIAGAAVFSRK